MLHIPKKALLMAARLRPQEVFATSLYTGNNSSQTITNGLDLAGKGGLVWFKNRTDSTTHALHDTARGREVELSSAATSADFSAYPLGSFNSNGFSLEFVPGGGTKNIAGQNYVAWSFRRAAKFFDIVTYAGNGVAGRQIAHSLGVVPGMIVVKRRDGANGWPVYHRSLGASNMLYLNTTDAALGFGNWNNTAPTATHFTVRNDSDVNATGATYVAYVFAQNPDLIDCGSYTGNGSSTGPVVTCGSGWRPQWLLVKNTTQTGTVWYIFDSARGLGPSTTPFLQAQSSEAEVSTTLLQSMPNGFQITATGPGINAAGNTYVYTAIRAPT